MRKLSFAIALIAVLGWSVAAHAGTVTQTYDIDDAWGSSGKTAAHLGILSIYVNFSAKAVDGKMRVIVSTPYSTFMSSVPPATAKIHVDYMKIQGWGTNMAAVANWTIMHTVMAQAAGSTLCHVGTSGMIAASCHAAFNLTTWAHCTNTQCSKAPGNFTKASQIHTNMWTTMSVHLGAAQITHGHSSAHFLKSFYVRLTPPGGHLVSSLSGYQTFHLGAKQTQ